MNGYEFASAIDDIEKAIQKFPEDVQPRLLALAKETAARHKQIYEDCRKAKKAIAELESAEADLRVAMQYILFDVEAAKRELDQKRQDLEGLQEC